MKKPKTKVYNAQAWVTEVFRILHELAITQNIIDIVLSEAKAAGAGKITKINLVIGELSGVVAECVQFYFDFLKEGNMAQEATIDFRLVPAEVRCRDCKTSFNLPNSTWVCTNCQGTSLEVLSGTSCYIESIEIE